MPNIIKASPIQTDHKWRIFFYNSYLRFGIVCLSTNEYENLLFISYFFEMHVIFVCATYMISSRTTHTGHVLDTRLMISK